MRKEGHEEKKDKTDRMAKMGIALIAILLLSLPVFALLASFQDDDTPGIQYQDQTGSITGDMSMDTASREAWGEFLSSAPAIEFSFIGPEGKVTAEDIEIDVNEPDLNGSDVEFRESSSDGNVDDEYTETPQAAKDSDRNDDLSSDAEGGAGAEDREVEESDIVKVIGDRMYVLSRYRGLVVVNLEDTSSPYIEGSVQVLGDPVSMYVLDFLGFVIVSNAPSLDGTGQYSGMMYIVDLLDNSAPRVVKTVELTGYPVDSRRVGEVIYVVSNEYSYNWGPWFGGGMLDTGDMIIDEAVEEPDIPDDEGPKTFVTSIAFTDPLTMGQRDKVVIDGDAGMIHSSAFEIYIPQPNYDYADPTTRFVYVDISDPKGDVEVRGTITLPGLLKDRFQMDHYKGTFRVVTQKWPSGQRWNELPMSTLYIVDARDPDHLKRISSLLIDDSGNLMATRFAGERAYTIHLPRTIDPLDVIDLSDPSDPKLTDILELPGWVEHMEVIGYSIIAIGVDDTGEDGWKVSISLFDVTDASNAILQERIVIGDGYTYSSANYDPKALTVLEDEELILIPFNSYGRERYHGQMNGVQIIDFDLEEGTLEEKGTIISDDNVERTRWMNDAVVTMSQRMVMAVDVSDLDSPEVLGRVELASNVADAFFADEKLVTLIEPYYGDTGGSIRVSSPSSPHMVISEFGPEGLEFTQMKRDGNDVYIKGIRQGGDAPPVSELYRYDLTDPMDPVEYSSISIDVPGSEYEYYYEKYEDDDVEIVDGGEAPSGTSEQQMVYYDPFSWEILNDGSVVVYRWEYSYYSSGSQRWVELNVVSWDDEGDPTIVNSKLPLMDYVQDIVGNSDRLLISSHDWWPPSSRIYDVDLTGENVSITSVNELTGRFIGTSEDLSKVYTEVTYFDDETAHYDINVYEYSGGQLDLVQSMDIGSPISDVRFNGDSIVVISQSWDYWYGYGYVRDDVYYDDDVNSGDGVVSDEEPYSDEKEGSSSSSSSATPGDPEEGATSPKEPYEMKGTEIVMIKLENGLFGEAKSLQLETTAYASLVTDEFLVLDSGSVHTVISFDDGLEELGSWYGSGWVRGGDLSDDDLVLALGMWGVEIREV